MRRKDREVPKQQIEEIIAKHIVCRLGLCDNNRPYIVPLNFGYVLEDEKLILYFHCAKVGRKLDIIRQNNQACFEMDSFSEPIIGEDHCSSTIKYESIIGSGIIEIVEDPNEKIFALESIMKHVAKLENPKFNEKQAGTVAILKLVAEEYVGKRYA